MDWLTLAAAVPLLGAFAARQRKLAASGGAPLVPPGLFAHRAFTVGLVSSIVFYAGMASFFLVLAVYLQQGRGLDALGSGLTFTPLAVGYLAASIAAQRLGRRSLTLGGPVRAARAGRARRHGRGDRHGRPHARARPGAAGRRGRHGPAHRAAGRHRPGRYGGP